MLLWSPRALFIRFRCRFRNIYAFEYSGGRRDELWLRDVAEIFIQPDVNSPGHYQEFEIAPSGEWLDLDILDKRKSCLLCDLKTRVDRSSATGIWIAEMAIPMHCLTTGFHPDQVWRLNLFRIEGEEPNRFYSAWRPTGTPEPNFHVPAHFGELYFTTA
jgi:alpha-galactosidase